MCKAGSAPAPKAHQVAPGHQGYSAMEVTETGAEVALQALAHPAKVLPRHRLTVMAVPGVKTAHLVISNSARMEAQAAQVTMEPMAISEQAELRG